MVASAFSSQELFGAVLQFLEHNSQGAWIVKHVPYDNDDDELPYFFAGNVEPNEMDELRNKVEVAMARAYPKRYRPSHQAFYNLEVVDNHVVYRPAGVQ